jgi:hypothetical protein
MDRFWAKVKMGQHAECWEWQGKQTAKRYGAFSVKLYGERFYRAHRVAWALHNGRLIPTGAVIMHSCDNRLCCNPAHLSPGTQTQNVADQVARGRRAKGEGHGRAKLTENDVRAIRSSTESISALARRYGVHWTTAAKARDGRFWPHVK